MWCFLWCGCQCAVFVISFPSDTRSLLSLTLAIESCVEESYSDLIFSLLTERSHLLSYCRTELITKFFFNWASETSSLIFPVDFFWLITVPTIVSSYTSLYCSPHLGFGLLLSLPPVQSLTTTSWLVRPAIFMLARASRSLLFRLTDIILQLYLQICQRDVALTVCGDPH